MKYIFTEDYTPFSKGEVITREDIRLGDRPNTEEKSSDESVIAHINYLIEAKAIKEN